VLGIMASAEADHAEAVALTTSGGAGA